MQARAAAWVLVLTAGGLAACGAAPPSTGAAARTYEIHLSGHVPAGTRWMEVAHLEDRRERHVRGQEASAPTETVETRVVDLRGDYTVVEVSEHGAETVLRIDVADLAWDVGQGVVHAPLPLVLRIDRREGGGITDAAGNAVDPAITAALEGIAPAPMHAHPSDDQLFGAASPQAVGASWPLDPSATARLFASFGATVDPANVHGETTFLSVDEVDGHEALHLRTVVSAHALQLPLPAGIVQHRGDALMSFEATYPTERALLPFDETMQMGMDIEASGPTPTGPATMAVAITRRLTRHRTMH